MPPLASAKERFQCAPSPIIAVDKTYNPGGWNYNRERVANAYGLFAAASYDAYEPLKDEKTRSFAIGDNSNLLKPLGDRKGSTGWRIVKKGANQSNGLSFDVYYRHEANRLIVLVAYRGTDGWLNVDLIANLSWFTQWFNPYDQYADARAQFRDVVSNAVAEAKGKPIAFITTGHSLGGGLAQHIAHLFPCVSTVVFNPSFVTNAALYGNTKPIVTVRVYEDKDVFSRLAPGINNTAKEADYKLNGALGSGINAQHSMEQLAAAMMRTALDCMKRTSCELRREGVREAYTLYCRRYRERRRMDVDPVCVRNAPAVQNVLVTETDVHN